MAAAVMPPALRGKNLGRMVDASVHGHAVKQQQRSKRFVSLSRIGTANLQGGTVPDLILTR